MLSLPGRRGEKQAPFRTAAAFEGPWTPKGRTRRRGRPACRRPAAGTTEAVAAPGRLDLRQGVAAALQQSAAAYGYTLSVWASGAGLIHLHGMPDVGDAALFVAGAVGGFTLVELVATRAFRRIPDPPGARGLTVAGALHFLSAGLAFGSAMLAGVAIGAAVVWPVAAFALTVVYLFLAGVQVTLAS